MPDNEFSSVAYTGTIQVPVKAPDDLGNAWERGGVALNNPSLGLQVKVWHAYIAPEGVMVEAPDVPASLVLAGAGITDIDLAFDQNMNPFIAFTQNDVAKFYWHDPLIPGMTTTTLPAGSKRPRCTMDEKRGFLTDISDILLFYVRDGSLCQRAQRDRYAIEYPMMTVRNTAAMAHVAMASNLRLHVGLSAL